MTSPLSQLSAFALAPYNLTTEQKALLQTLSTEDEQTFVFFNQIIDTVSFIVNKGVYEDIDANNITNRANQLSDSGVELNSSVSVTNAGVADISNRSSKGVSDLRPEIIAVTDFNPVFDETQVSLTPYGTFLDVQNKALSLRRDNLIQLIQNLVTFVNNNNDITDNTKRVFDLVNGNLDSVLNSTKNTIQVIGRLHQSIQSIKDYLDFYDEYKAHNVSFNFSIQNASTNFSTFDNIVSAPHFVDKYIQYTPQQVDQFSNTRLYLQLLIDLRAMMESYGFTLFNNVDPDRRNTLQLNKINPFTLDLTYDNDRDKKFTVKNWLPSDGTRLIATNVNNFQRFYGLLPGVSVDRAKILIHTLSKELIISKGLTTNQNLLNKFGFNASSGNPFDNIIGIPGTSVTELPSGEQSLAKLAYISDTNQSDVVVLPFESKFIDANTSTSKKFIPGSVYLADSILENVVPIPEANTFNFNTSPVKTWTTEAVSKIEDGISLIKNLLGVEPYYEEEFVDWGVSARLITTYNKYSIPMYKDFLHKISDSTRYLVYEQSNSPKQALACALLKYAHGDSYFRLKLFQHLALAGFSIKTNLFKDMVVELNNDPNQLNLIPLYQNILQGDISSALNESSEMLKARLALSADELETYIKNIMYKKRYGKNITENFFSYADQAYGEFAIPNNLSGEIYDENGFIKSLSDQLNNSSGILIRKGEIKDLLMNIFATNTTTDPNRNVLGHIVGYASELYDLSRDSFFATNNLNSQSTRFSNLSLTGFFLMVYEIMSDMTQMFAKADLAADIYLSDSYVVYVNNELQNTINNEITKYLSFQTGFNRVTRTDERIYQQVSKVSSNPLASSTTGPYSIGTRSTFDLNFNSTTGKWSPSLSISYAGTFQNAGTNFWDKTKGFDPNANRKSFSKSLSTKSVEEIEKIFGTQYGSISTSGYHEQMEMAFVNELKGIEGILSILNLIKTNLAAAKQKAITEFDTAFAAFGAYAISIRDLLNIVSALNVQKDLSFIKDKSQLYLIQNYYNKTKNELANAPQIETTTIDDAFRPFFIGIKPSQKETSILYKYLSQPQFLLNNSAEDRTKIFSIGIPNGFSKTLTERINRESFAQILNNKVTFKEHNDTDVVSINLYKRDLRFPEIIFKPKKYLFNLSLFQDTTLFTSITDDSLPSTSYDVIRNKAYVNDYQDSIDGERFRFETIVNKPKYAQLSSQQRKEMFKNEFESYFLSRYINLMTGINLNEYAFFKNGKNAGQTSSTIFNIQNTLSTVARVSETTYMNLIKLIKEYLFVMYNVSIDENTLISAIYSKSLGLNESLFDNLNISIEAKDIIRILSVSPVFDPANLQFKTWSPKLFERVYHIAVNTDELSYIDVEKTVGSTSGRTALQNASFQQLLDEDSGIKTNLNRGQFTVGIPSDGLKFKTPSINDVTLVDYFITIEGNDV